MKIEKLADKYVNINTNLGMGSGIVSFFKQFVPNGAVITEIAAFQITFQGLSHWIPAVPIYFIIMFVIGKYYGWMLVNYFIGRMMHRTGAWERINQYVSKKDHLNPFQVEEMAQFAEYTRVINSLAEIAGSKERVEDKFTKI